MRPFTKSILPALVLALASANPAYAAPTELESSPMMQDGKQVGCQFTFSHSQLDPVHFGKGEATVEGSMSILKFDKNIIFALKIGVTGPNGTTRMGPFDAYFGGVENPTTTSLLTKMDADDKGYRLFAFNADEATIAATISMPGKERVVRLSYRMKDGGALAPVAISFDTEAGRQAYLGWLGCIEGITK